MPRHAGTGAKLAGSPGHGSTDDTGKPFASNLTPVGHCNSPVIGSFGTADDGNTTISTASVCSGMGLLGCGRSTPAIEHRSACPVSSLQTEMYGDVESSGLKMRMLTTARHNIVTAEHDVTCCMFELKHADAWPDVTRNRNSNGGSLHAASASALPAQAMTTSPRLTCHRLR